MLSEAVLVFKQRFADFFSPILFSHRSPFATK